jgi:hypothetical protein
MECELHRRAPRAKSHCAGHRRPDRGAVAPAVVASYGMGADSAAIILRWIHEPARRDFDLHHEFVLITSMVGDEYESTRTDVEQVVLPSLREHAVRFIQVGRSRCNVTHSGGAARAA